MTAINEKIHNNSEDEDLNLKPLKNIILRNRKFILTFTFLTFVLFCFNALSRKRIWEGNFQIVLRKKDAESSKTSTLNILGGQELGLQTEVSILKSQSILMPVFNFVNEEKRKIYPNFTPPLFSDWEKKNLNIKLKERTKILNIVYQDVDNSLILPVLSQISEAYQNYSLRNKKRSLELTKEFLNEKISEYRLKSIKSLENLQEYASKEDLALLNFGPVRDKRIFSSNNLTRGFNISNPTQSKITPTADISSMISNLNIENIRVQAANKIREIDAQIELIQEVKDGKELRYLLNDPDFKGTNVLKPIQDIELQLLELRTRYTDNDPFIIRKQQQLDLLIKDLKARKLGFLNNAKSLAKAQLKAATRPQDVLIKYKKLMRDASREENALLEMEDLLIAINLEEAKREDPWELISEANLIPYPVAPSRTRIGLIGIILGSFLSIFISYIREKTSKIIFESGEIEDLTGAKILETINLNSNDLKTYSKSVFANEILGAFNKKRFGIIKSKGISKQECKTIFEEIFENNYNYTVLENFLDINDNDIVVFITSIGSLTKKDLNQFIYRLKLQNKKIDFILLTEKS